jgi:hypothetical protein
MRPTALARGELPVFLYVLADHRVETPAAFAEEVYQQPGQAIGWANVPYAQWIEPAALDQDSPLAPFVQRKLFLTKFDIFLYNPAGISDDFVFPFAARDETYHEVQVQYVVDVDPNAAPATGAPEATADPSSFWIVAGLALLWVPLVLVLLFAGARHWRRP